MQKNYLFFICFTFILNFNYKSAELFKCAFVYVLLYMEYGSFFYLNIYRESTIKISSKLNQYVIPMLWKKLNQNARLLLLYYIPSQVVISRFRRSWSLWPACEAHSFHCCCQCVISVRTKWSNQCGLNQLKLFIF